MAKDIEDEFDDDSEEEDIYGEKGREELEESEEISPEEEGFMEGYEGVDNIVKCSMCGKVLSEDFIEEEISGKVHRFCSAGCADKYAEKHPMKER